MIRTAILSVATLALLGLPAYGQGTSGSGSSSRPSLTERLDSFRRSLVGGSSEAEQDAPQQSVQAPKQSRSRLDDESPTLAQPRCGSMQTARRPIEPPVTKSAPSMSAPTKSPSMKSTPAAKNPLPSGPGSVNRVPSHEAAPSSQREELRQPGITSSANRFPPIGTSPRTASLPTTGPSSRNPQAHATETKPVATKVPEIKVPEPRPAETPVMARSERTPLSMPERTPLSQKAPLSQKSFEPAAAAPVASSPSAAQHDSGAAHSPATRSTAAPDQVLISRGSPSLNVETTGPRRITVGKEAEYTVTLKNEGDQPAADVVVSVAIPQSAEVTYTRATLGSAIANSTASEGLQWKITNLEAHATQVLSIKLVPRKSDAFDLGVRWTFTPTLAKTTVEVEEPLLKMAVSGPTEVVYGERQLYKLTISNPGTGAAEGVVLHLNPIDPREGTRASHRIGVLGAGESQTVEIELTARQAGRIAVSTEATADGGLKSAATQEVLVHRANLQVQVTGPKVHYAGAPANYEVRVKNIGDAPATNVSLVSLLPGDAELITSEHDLKKGEVGNHDITWAIENLPAGMEQAFTVKCVMKSAGPNRIEANCTADGDLRQGAEAVTKVLALADLQLELTDTPGPVPVGQASVYEIHVKNRGTSAAQNVEVVAFFSNGIEAIGVEGGRHEIRPGTVMLAPISSLAPGGDAIFKITAKASAAGNHRVRVELQCNELGTRLTQEDTTLFYGEDGTGGSAATSPEPRTFEGGATLTPRFGQ